MDDQQKKAFDFAQESTKQLISLGTAIIGLSVTFAKDIFQNPTGFALAVLIISWLAFLLSIVGGAWALLALTGELEPSQPKDGGAVRSATATPSIRGRNVTIPSVIQILSFLFGLLLTVIYGIYSVL